MSENENLNGKKVFLLKKKYIVVSSVVAVLLIVFFAVFMSLSSKDEISIFYSSAESGAVVVCGDRLADSVLPGKSVASVRYSENKTGTAVLMSEGSSYALYYTNGKKNVKVADNCTNDYVISLDGSKIMYCDSSDGLYLFDTKNKKTTFVDTQVNKFCLSPAGKVAIYTKVDSSEEKMYIYNGSSTVQLSVNYTPLSVSDDGGFIFALKSDNSLYVLDKNGSVTAKICSVVSADKFYISSDMKNIVFDDGSYTYISQNGKSRVRLIPHKASPVQMGVSISCDSDGKTSVCENLTEIFYSSVDENSECTLFYFDSNCTRTDVAGNVKKYNVADSQELVYLSSDGKIYRYEKGRTDMIVSGAADMLSDSDGKYIYYIDSSQTLYAIKKTFPVLLAAGVEKMYMTNDDLMLFVMTDSRLYSARRDKRAEFMDENVYGCVCNSSATFYVKNYNSDTGRFELFATDTGKKFRLIHENISNII